MTKMRFMEIKGKAAVVTGSSRGVGRATALAFAKEGCSVAVNYSRSKEEAEETAQQVHAMGVEVICLQGDVSEDQACRELMSTAADAFGRLDILVNNAGVTQFIAHEDLDKVRKKHWDQILGINVVGPFQCARAAQFFIQQSGGGEIVNVTSIAGITGRGSSIPYSASKAALLVMTKSLARVMGPDIRVNSVAPGFIDGHWLRKGLGSDYEKFKEMREGQSALGKICGPEDVADAILSIIAGSDLVTGQTIVCDGRSLVGV